jgi:hypothetical protein
VQKCHEEGLFQPGATVEEVALAGWALCHGLAALHTEGALTRTLPVDVNKAATRLIHFLLRGVLAIDPRSA